MHSFTKLFCVPVPLALLPVFHMNDTVSEMHELHTLNIGHNVIVGVIIKSRLLRESGLGMLKKQNNEKMHKIEMMIFPWNLLD